MERNSRKPGCLVTIEGYIYGLQEIEQFEIWCINHIDPLGFDHSGIGINFRRCGTGDIVEELPVLVIGTTYADRNNIAATSTRVRIRATSISAQNEHAEQHKRVAKSYRSFVNVFVYSSNITGGGLHPKIPWVQGLPVVVRPSTTLQLSS